MSLEICVPVKAHSEARTKATAREMHKSVGVVPKCTHLIFNKL